MRIALRRCDTQHRRYAFGGSEEALALKHQGQKNQSLGEKNEF
jgi:hypothetical protein